MELRILGPFEVADGGARLELGGYKQRATLAILLLSANRTVLTDRLVDDLWGDRPPRQALASLQAYVSNLRRILEPDRRPRAPARVLRSQPSGYLLAIDPAGVDAAEFERLAAEGRAELRDGRPREAHDRFDRALALWRGPALADFRDEPFARADAARLEELRAATLEDRIAADLALGEHAAVVAELEILIAEDPLRERLWAHLMVALYRSGRQAEALAAYQRCRRTLDDQLGVDPSPALRRLEADVLRHAPSLEWRPDGAGAARAGVPPSLVHRDGTGRLHVYPLDERGPGLTVGRDAASDIWLPWDARISRFHARLECDGDGWAVVDDGPSTNGTYVNDERVEGRRGLADGDEVRFGDTVVVFRSPLHAAAVETALE